MIKKGLASGILAIVAVTVLVSCGGDSVVGEWVEPVPGMENQVQGVCLEAGGKASSINMATLQYEYWEKNDDKLILSGKSIGNGASFTFKDTLTIQKLTDDEIKKKKGSLTINYKKQSN